MKSVLIVEDVVEAQSWLSDIVRQTFPEAVISIADSVASAAKMTDQTCDLALIDLGLPDGSGLEVLRHVNASAPNAVKIVTTIMGDDASIVGALSAGADGYLLKESEPSAFMRQLAQVSLGMPAISPSVARRIMDHFRLTGPTATQDGKLTDRETEVLELIALGMRNAEVASELGIATTTVAGYIKIIYSKLGIGSRAEAAWHANRLGLRPKSP